ncbi:MAG: STAS domain-containing protein [Spirochaetes bacterium]|nr:STAS domain-containing protein [Spirochaetota bacterium]
MTASVSIVHCESAGADMSEMGGVICLVTPDRRMSADLARDFWICLKTLVQGGCRWILVDMSGVTFLDSTGIGAMINAAKLVRQGGGELAVACVSAELTAILDLVSFRRFINTFDTIPEAVGFFEGRRGS